MDISGAQVTEDIPGFVLFEPGEKTAVIILFLVALLSTLLLSFVLLCVAWVVFSSTFKHTPGQNFSREAFFFRSQLGQYATCLLLSNWIRGVSGTIDVDWIRAGGVKPGTHCTAQGSLRQIGEYASFFFIVTMGIHTLSALVLRNRPPRWLGIAVISTGWASSIVIGITPASVTSDVNGPFYNIDHITCDISKSYGVAQMLLYFLPLFFASLISVIVYSLIFLMLRGTIVFNAGLKIHFNPERRLRPQNETFEEYQRFIYSVARTMLWLPISFIIVLLPSSVIQLMDISGITVSPGAMVLSCILERLDGVINVLILFRVLRTLSPDMQSSHSTDSEKGHSGKAFISRPLNGTKSFLLFPPKTQRQVTKSTTLQGGASSVSSLAKSLFRSHKKTGSTSSSTHMLIREPPSRGHSPASSLERLDSSSSTLPSGRPTPELIFQFPMPPEAAQKSTRPNPHGIDSTRSLISRNRKPPAIVPPFLEVTLCSSPTTPPKGGVGSEQINMYISSDDTMNAELPPFPDTAVHRDSSVSLPRSFTSPSGWPATRFPVLSAIDPPMTVPPGGFGSPLKAVVSMDAAAERPADVHILPPAPHPTLPPTRTTSLSGAANGSRYPDSEGEAPPSPAARDTTAGAQSGASREGPLSDQGHPALQTLPLSRSLLSHSDSVKLHKVPSSSSRYGYL